MAGGCLFGGQRTQRKPWRERGTGSLVCGSSAAAIRLTSGDRRREGDRCDAMDCWAVRDWLSTNVKVVRSRIATAGMVGITGLGLRPNCG